MSMAPQPIATEEILRCRFHRRRLAISHERPLLYAALLHYTMIGNLG